MTKAILLARGYPWSFSLQGRGGDQFFGYNDHFGQGYNAYLTAAGTFRSLNARVWRDALPWQDVEPSAGSFNFTPTGNAWGQDFFNFLAQQIANGYSFFQYWTALYGNSNYATDVNSAVWRGKLATAMVEVATRLMAAGQPANRLVFCLDNEPNSSANAMAPWYQGSGTEATYTRTCKVLRDALKAFNPAIRVANGETIDGDHGFYATWRAAQQAEPDYFASMDILSNHLYSNNNPTVGTLAPPEELFDRCAPFFQAQLNAAVAAGRSDITTAITECGGGPAETEASELYRRISRMPFVFSMLPGLEFYIHYAGRDVVNDYGIMESDAFTLRFPAVILGDAFAHLNIATNRQRYTDPRGGVAVKLTVPDASGRRRVALWNTQGSTMARIIVEASGPCDLRIKIMGGSTDTRAIGAGLSNVSGVKTSPWAQVVYTDTPGVTLAFPELGG